MLNLVDRDMFDLYSQSVVIVHEGSLFKHVKTHLFFLVMTFPQSSPLGY